MRFYKIQGDITTDEGKEYETITKQENARKVAIKTAEFNGANTEKCCFLSIESNNHVTFGIISTDIIDLIDFAKTYAKFIGFSVEFSFPEEITLSNLQKLLKNADRNFFIDNDEEILERFGLDRICGRGGRGLEFGENLVNYDARKEELVYSAEKLFMNDTLIPELDRIYAGTKALNVYGHPVHYIVETDDRDTRRSVYKIILDALYVNHRLGSTRYAFLDFHPGENYSHMTYEALYKISEGGAVVVRYMADEDSADEGFSASAERETIEHICETAKLYRNKVLTVLCLPRECKKNKAIFYECLGNMAFVELRENYIDSTLAKDYLTSLSKEKHIRTDKKLFSNLEEDHCYLTADLHRIFDEWYNSKLKNSIYPQYKDVAVAHQEVVKAKPQGSAYDELMEMIGLEEAKKIIKKALNYYKMQKLYEEKGVKRDTPAMHMIFSGNPGTAKTTVARLFARIMRENGILSRGQLIEVGRGDLVGKYVGWTAQTVQAKFKAASGGVLFIDEAYSLVDDRDGSFGDEAINTIVQEMENHRSDVVVIFAGYPDKMENFLQKNPGLRSRIAFHVPFADYNSTELCRIAEMIGKKNGMKIEKDALEKLEKVFDIARADEDFGNGRYVRNIFEQSKMNQASRLLEKEFDSISAADVTTITADDIIIPTTKKTEKIRIGFC